MTTWVDRGAWHPVRALEVAKYLSTSYPNPAQSTRLLQDAGLVEFDDPAGRSAERWREIVRALVEQNALRTLLEHVQLTAPASRVRVTTLMLDDPPAPGNPPDPFDVRIVGTSSTLAPIIDRVELRRAVRELIEEGGPVLVIRGPDSCGKTHSLRVIRHVAAVQGRPQYILADFSPAAYQSADVESFVGMIRAALALPDVETRDRYTTKVKQAGQLIAELSGHVRLHDDGRRRILCIDGLDRIDLDQSMQNVISLLVTAVANEAWPNVQLVLTGYPHPLAPGSGALDQSVLPVDREQVKEFLTALDGEFGTSVGADRIQEWTDDVMKDAPTMAQIAERVTARVKELQP